MQHMCRQALSECKLPQHMLSGGSIACDIQLLPCHCIDMLHTSLFTCRCATVGGFNTTSHATPSSNYIYAWPAYVWGILAVVAAWPAAAMHLLLLGEAHLFFRVPFWCFLLSVACQWFFTPLSVRPFSSRAIAANKEEPAGQRLAEARDEHSKLAMPGVILTCPSVLMHGLRLRDKTRAVGKVSLTYNRSRNDDSHATHPNNDSLLPL